MAKDKPEVTLERSFTQNDIDKIVQERLARDRATRAVDAVRAGHSINEVRASLGFPPFDTRVVSEPRVYALDSPHSYYCDTIQTRLDPHAIMHSEARERLTRYATELAHEMERRSREGLRAERVIREATRETDQRIHERRFRSQIKELRAVTTGGGTTASAAAQAAAFVPPAFLMDDYALFRDSYRTFADQCHVIPLLPYGMQVYLPFFQSAAAEGQQTEFAGVTELDPTTSLQNSPVVTIAGQITVTQQMFDRFTGGGGADVVFNRQLHQHLGTKLDTFALQQVIAGGTTVSDSSALGANSIARFLADVGTGREQITDTAGIRLRPTHFFSTYDLYSNISSVVGTTGAPLLTITETPGVPIQGYPIPRGADDGLTGGDGGPAWSRFTGVILPGTLLWFTDDNIPALSGNTQMLVSAPDQAVIIMESAAPVLAVFPTTYANNLAVIVTLYEYAAVLTRHAAGTAVITGNTYPTSLK